MSRANAYSGYPVQPGVVNRVWAEFMGFGIVEPVDDFDLVRYDPKNPPPAPWTLQPSNPELLDAMAQNFSKNNFSFRLLVQTILNRARTSFLRASRRVERRVYLLLREKYVRVLSAAELHDAIVLATAVPANRAGSNE